MAPRTDSYRHRRRRLRLLEALQRKGIQDKAVLDAMSRVPRHLFIREEQADEAYEDHALPFAEGQTISQPYTVACQTELLQVRPGMKVLEIGTGSGYQAAVLCELGAEVYSVERIRSLYERNCAFPLLQAFKNLHLYFSDGQKGIPDEAPFDRILLTAAAAEWPAALLGQLGAEGQMVFPFGAQGSSQVMMRVRHMPDGGFIEECFDHFHFVPLLPGTQ